MAVVGIMTVMGLFGLAVADLIAKSDTMRSDHSLYERATSITQAAIEYGIKKIYDGVSPVVAEPGINFGKGNFVISQSARTLTITSRLGEVSVTRQVDSPTEADCGQLDVSSASTVGGGDTLTQIQVKKICLIQVVLDKLRFSWTPDNGEKIVRIKIENATVYNDPAGNPSGTLLDITNYVMNNPNQNNMNGIEFDQSVTGKTFTLDVFYGDGTAEQVAFIPN